ncbi:T9SS type A sorting domain-containing protein [Olleya sp. R77988]|uniref:T9SS type A sorting domain-containing protein n=1 Tax=Olleya sp. R77988 TaxID=3093875 RepID=UPI0037C814A2
MKTFYSTILLLFISVLSLAQAYTYGIVSTGNFDFKIVAIPDFSASTDASDMGFALVLPAGSDDIINATSLLAARTWQVQQFDAAFLTGQGLGDGTKDVFLFNNPPGQSLIAHNAGDQIDLVYFSLSTMPSNGEIAFLDNSDPIAIGASGVLDSFYNSNIDNTSTQDYFGGLAAGLENFMFSTLGVVEAEMLEASITIYPNPTVDSITIKASAKIESAVLFDITGKIVLNQKLPETMDLSKLPSGVYLLQLKTNRTTVTKRVVKK